jgi:hypothetical protein
MKQRPILFSTEMVNALLSGRKTQTRRVVKFKDHLPGIELNFLPSAYPHFQFQSGNRHWQTECPYGKKGDVLWVRESCLWVMRDHAHDLLEGSRDRNKWVYKASQGEDWIKYAKEKYGYKWKPSIHMPKEASRIWLRITNVRVERLHYISNEDAAREGIERMHRLHWWRNYLNKPLPGTSSPIESFKSLWQSINGIGSWKQNPWVWVVEFERIEKT